VNPSAPTCRRVSIETVSGRLRAFGRDSNVSDVVEPVSAGKSAKSGASQTTRGGASEARLSRISGIGAIRTPTYHVCRSNCGVCTQKIRPPFCHTGKITSLKFHDNVQNMKKEYIKCEAGDRDAWVCICGNMPCDDGFYPCDKRGNEVEPVEGVWLDPIYVCHACGRIINQDTLEVIGRKARRSSK
jgi:hypothetical protein